MWVFSNREKRKRSVSLCKYLVSPQRNVVKRADGRSVVQKEQTVSLGLVGANLMSCVSSLQTKKNFQKKKKKKKKKKIFFFPLFLHFFVIEETNVWQNSQRTNTVFSVFALNDSSNTNNASEKRETKRKTKKTKKKNKKKQKTKKTKKT